MILGIDPGREKIGLAVVDEASDQIVWQKIVAPADFRDALAHVLSTCEIHKIALGNSTASEKVRAQIEAVTAISLQVVDEKNSTLEARAWYFRAHPPRSWKRWLPLSLQTPDIPIDDFAAAVIARRAF